MTRLLAIIGLVVCVALSGAAAAQEATPPIDYDAFETVASVAETLVEDPTVSDARLEEIREQLSEQRARLLAAQDVNETAIARLQGQIEALGPPPEEGQEEPAEIAERREELNRQLSVAQVPRVTATEAYNRADGLIGEIDMVLRARQNEQLLERAPSPLVPSHWQDAATSLVAVATNMRNEFGQAFQDDTRRAALRDGAVVTIGLVAAGLLLILRGRSWAGRLAGLVYRRRARSTVVFIASFGQVLLPVVGAVMLVAAAISTGVTGQMGTMLLLGLIGFLSTTFLALWLGGRLFPPDPADLATLDLSASDRAMARRTAVGIGIMVGLAGVLEVLSEFDEVSPATDGVLLLPVYLILGVLFWRFGKLLVAARDSAKQADEASFATGAVGLVGRALLAVAVAGPVLAIAGYQNAAQSLMVPAALTLGVIAFLLALQVPIRDLYSLISRTPVEEAPKALIPVLVNFALALLALPVLALIWGMRPAELSEVYARFSEGFSLGETRVTPGDVAVVLVVFGAALLFVRIVQGALRSTVLPRTRMDTGAQNAIVSGIGYVGIAIAALIAINTAGIDLTALAFVISALSVGIGFGLRNVIENFVAGIILLIERPIGEGDWIEVGGNMGIVKSISVRSTVIETFDKQQLIVPNGDFITGTVTNWTRGSFMGRAVVLVGVAYGTDTRRVQEILLEIARENPSVMHFPEPGVDFLGFGADSLDFRIRAVLYDVNQLLSVKTEIHHRIAERFTEEGIEIPFAQRDIWLRNPETLQSLPRGEHMPPPAEARPGPGSRDAQADARGETR